MSLHGSNGRTINVEKKTLLEALKKNLIKHKTDFQDALEGYKLKLITDLSACLKAVQEVGEGLDNGNLERLANIVPVKFIPPVSHSAEYEEVIEMMELSTDTIINLDTAAYRQYFKDEWTWSGAFNANATLYKNYKG